ncbi:MAG: trehalose-phosphatase [Pseudomonadota bacterium]
MSEGTKGGDGDMMYYQMTGFMGGAADTTQSCGAADLPDPDAAALLLDFDGTLVDIAEKPMDVVVPDATRDLLSRAWEKLDGRVAIVSGRMIGDLEHFLPEFRGPLVGTHGAEMRLDGVRSPTAEFDEATISRVQRLVQDFGALRPEFHVETKPTGIVLHFRQAEAQSALALRFMESVAAAADGMRLQPALMAYEIKPESVGKDVALQTLLTRPEFEGALPVYSGDDLTDEPALQLVQDRGGCGIKIGEAETVAKYRLHGPPELAKCLGEWLA